MLPCGCAICTISSVTVSEICCIYFILYYFYCLLFFVLSSMSICMLHILLNNKWENIIWFVRLAYFLLRDLLLLAISMWYILIFVWFMLLKCPDNWYCLVSVSPVNLMFVCSLFNYLYISFEYLLLLVDISAIRNHVHI